MANDTTTQQDGSASLVKVWRPTQNPDVEFFKCGAGVTNQHPKLLSEFCISVPDANNWKVQIGKHTHVASEGDLILAHPGDIIACKDNVVDDMYVFRTILCAPHVLESAMAGVQGRPSTPRFPGAVFRAPDLIKKFRTLHQKLEDPTSGIDAEGSLRELLEQIIRTGDAVAGQPKQSSERKPVDKAREYLEQNYQKDVGLSDLAEIAGRSPFHLSRMFSEQVGLPPHAYLTQIRLGKAKALLATGTSVAQAAHEVGFYDQSHLSNHFKRVHGISPGAYRRLSFA